MHGIHRDMPETAYHAHEGSLSVSGAKVLLRSPALYRWQREHPVHRDVFDVGTAAHSLILGTGPTLVVIEADDWRSKAAREARDAARANGCTPILTRDHERVRAMADELIRHRLASQLLAGGEAEVSAFAPDEPTGVLRRARFDHLGDGVIVDYKTAASSDPSAFARSAASFGYHMQAAWYLDVAAALDLDAEAFAFIVQEKEPPYQVTVCEIDERGIDLGRDRNRAALERFRDCTESGLWPGYVPDDQIARVSLPRWVHYDSEAETA